MLTHVLLTNVNAFTVYFSQLAINLKNFIFSFSLHLFTSSFSYIDLFIYLFFNFCRITLRGK